MYQWFMLPSEEREYRLIEYKDPNPIRYYTPPKKRNEVTLNSLSELKDYYEKEKR